MSYHQNAAVPAAAKKLFQNPVFVAPPPSAVHIFGHAAPPRAAVPQL
jgi:hypothetical protein